METYLHLSSIIGRGDPGSAWCFGLGAHHALSVCSHWPPDIQDKLFTDVNGDFIAPHRAPPAGKATPVEGGYVISGEWRYSSGVPYATHFIGATFAPGDDPDGPPQVLTFTIPRSQFSIKPGSWGDGESLGLQASGSQTVVVENQLVPAEMVFPLVLFDTPDTTPGLELHGNPIYLGRLGGFFHAGLVATVVGAAGAALDEYERLMREGPTTGFGVTTPGHRINNPDYVRHYGEGLALRDAAEAILIRCGQLYDEYCRRHVEEGRKFTLEDDLRIWTLAQQGGRLAFECVDLLFRIRSRPCRGWMACFCWGRRRERSWRNATERARGQCISTATRRWRGI
jgi:3-hydroxy-9,10-secoandrosta-1,3,5(10)-triene-9,17-dione monooxygenase